jgi:DNA-binding NarL/FixJ family response regulator
MKIRVAVVEDDPDFGSTLALYLNEAPGFECVAAYDTAEEALEKLPGLAPDVVLMDVHLPGMTGVTCTRQLKEICPAIQIMILTMYEDSVQVFGALKAGASGYLLKRADPAEVLRAIQDVKQGGAPMSSQIARQVVEAFLGGSNETAREIESLSEREEEILQHLSTGYSTKEIADRLFVSVNTIRTHLKHIYEKLHVRSRTEAVIKFLR